MLKNPFITDPTQDLMIATLAEFERILGKGVAGEPIKVGDTTLIPIYVTTFGIGVGGGSVFGETVGGGGGGGTVPCAIVIVERDGVRIQHFDSGFVSSATKSHTDMASDVSNRHSQAKPRTSAVPEPAPMTASIAPPVSTTPATATTATLAEGTGALVSEPA
jgi:uncharacterized spore protein YtfJ